MAGATHKLRAALGFSDARRWREFSRRRLELIDKFGLGSRPASEQDAGVRQIASILRVEFGYASSRAVEFERLVTMAVQSVRRNRKRAGRIAAGVPDSEFNTCESPLGAVSSTASPDTLTKVADVSVDNDAVQGPPSCDQLREPTSLFEQRAQMLSTTSPPRPPEDYNVLIRHILYDLVHEVVPLSAQGNMESSMLTINLIRDDQPVLPFFLREKLLQQVQLSRECLNLASSNSDLESQSQLTRLGNKILEVSLSYNLSKSYSYLGDDTINFIYSRTLTEANRSHLAVVLFDDATKLSMETLPISEVNAKVLNLILGALVKDFGFNDVLYPLSECLNHLILWENPMQILQSPCYNTLPLDLQNILNGRNSKRVLIRYQSQEFEFSFQTMNRAPPTVKEITENCKTLFKISSTEAALMVYSDDRVLNDERLYKILTGNDVRELQLEVKLLEPSSINSNNLREPSHEQFQPLL